MDDASPDLPPMTTIPRIVDTLRLAGLIAGPSDSPSGLLPTDFGIGVSRGPYHGGGITVCPQCYTAPYGGRPLPEHVADFRTMYDRATAALTEAGMAPFSKVGWRSVLCVGGTLSA